MIRDTLETRTLVEFIEAVSIFAISSSFFGKTNQKISFAILSFSWGPYFFNARFACLCITHIIPFANLDKTGQWLEKKVTPNPIDRLMALLKIQFYTVDHWKLDLSQTTIPVKHPFEPVERAS